jgi:hypothetical protein
MTENRASGPVPDQFLVMVSLSILSSVCSRYSLWNACNSHKNSHKGESDGKPQIEWQALDRRSIISYHEYRNT